MLDRRGFTMIELLVGVGISAVVMVALLSLFMTNQKQNRELSVTLDNQSDPSLFVATLRQDSKLAQTAMVEASGARLVLQFLTLDPASNRPQVAADPALVAAGSLPRVVTFEVKAVACAKPILDMYGAAAVCQEVERLESHDAVEKTRMSFGVFRSARFATNDPSDTYWGLGQAGETIFFPLSNASGNTPQDIASTAVYEATLILLDMEFYTQDTVRKIYKQRILTSLEPRTYSTVSVLKQIQ